MGEKIAAARAVAGMAAGGERGLYIQLEPSPLKIKAIWTHVKGWQSPENLNLLSAASKSFNHKVVGTLEFQPNL